METIIIPDIHGRDFYKPILSNAKDRIIFLGDFCDSYGFENIPYDNMKNNLLEILEFADNNKDRVIILISNHDIHYYTKTQGYSRYDYFNASELENIFNRYKHLFKMAYWDGDILFTHAGVTQDWWETKIQEKNDPQYIADYLNNLFLVDPLDFIEAGYSRGGALLYGNPIWADIREHYYAEKHLPFKQIFGHSQLETTFAYIKKHNFILCDSRAIFKLNKENFELIKYDNAKQ